MPDEELHAKLIVPDTGPLITHWRQPTAWIMVLDQDRDRMISMTTWDFLQGLEEAHRINSAEEVYRRAEDAGRLASRRAALAASHERAIAAVKELLRRPRDEPGGESEIER